MPLRKIGKVPAIALSRVVYNISHKIQNIIKIKYAYLQKQTENFEIIFSLPNGDTRELTKVLDLKAKKNSCALESFEARRLHCQGEVISPARRNIWTYLEHECRMGQHTVFPKSTQWKARRATKEGCIGENYF